MLAYVLAGADEVGTRAEAQTWLRHEHYAPTQLELDTVTRLGARLTRANIAFSDHPPELRWAGHIQTVTVASIIDFLKSRSDSCAEKSCPELVLRLENP
jgi:hypothetical protein